MGNIVSCLNPGASSHGATASDNFVVVQEAGATTHVGYRFGKQQQTRTLKIVPPATPAQPESNSPTTTTATATSKHGDRANNGGQVAADDVVQQVGQEHSDYANREDDGFFNGAESEPTAPFSWQRGRQIGQGAFGTVYMALVHATGQEIAVKQVSLPRDAASNGKVSGHIRSLEREVAVLRTLRHENIVRYLGTERTDEHLNIFLEYVAGGPLSSKLAQFGPLREETIRVYTKQILRGLEYLHQQKVMHRDIKGANILVDTNGVVKLADFGASKKIENLATIGGGSRSLHGTAHWMAPEVIKQLGHGRAADIWSLACVVIEMATGQPPWATFRDPLSVMFHVASTKEMPAMPEHLTPHAKDFLTLCFNRVPHERPNATRLLQHPWLQGVAVPRSNRPPPSLLPIPAPGPTNPQPQPPQQPQTGPNPHVAPKPPMPPPVQQPQQMPPPPGLRSPPSPIKEESDSRYGSPAAVAAGASTPTTGRGVVFGAEAGTSAAPATGLGFTPPPASRPPIPPLPLDAMKMGMMGSQGTAQQAMSSSSSNAVQGGASMAPTRPPLPPQPVSAQRTHAAQPAQNEAAAVQPDAVQLQMPFMQQLHQALPQNTYDSICMGVGMTISIPEGQPGMLHPATTMTLSGYNPIEEPSWMPGQGVLSQAVLRQLAAVSEHSTPQSPDCSSGGAPTATTTALAVAPGSSACGQSAVESSDGPDAPCSARRTDTVKVPAVAPLSELAAVTLSPRSEALTQRSGYGTQRSGAGTHRGTARGIKLEGTSGKPVVVPARPALAGLFAAAYEEDGDTHVEPDQPSPAAKPPAAARTTFSPNSTLKTHVRQSTAPNSARHRASTARRALEETGNLGGTLDPMRAKQWRDELEAELEAERMRAAAVVQHRESISTAASAT